MEVFNQIVTAFPFVQQLPKRSDVFFGGCVEFSAFLIAPMRGHAQFRKFMHGLGADLNFDAVALFIQNHGMQGLIAVFLGIGDIIVKFLGNVLPASYAPNPERCNKAKA